MSDQLTTSSFEDILKKYLPEQPKGGDPASNSGAASPINIRLGNEQLTVNSHQELQAALDQRLAQIGDFVRQQEEEKRLLAERLKEAPSTTPNSAAQPQQNDPVSFVEELLADPKSALSKVIQGSDIGEKLANISRLEQQLEKQAFTAAHPLYGNNPKIMGGLEQLCKDRGWQVNAQNLEIAAGWAQNAGFLPHENALRAQQQQAFLQLLAAQAQQAQGQGQVPGQMQQQPPWGQPAAPPPTTTGVAGSMPSESQLTQLVNMADKMSAEDLRRVLSQIPGGSI